MIILDWTDFLQKPPSGKSAVTIGVFDGIHIGHRALIEKIKEKKAKEGLTSIVITFKRHPRRILKPEKTHTEIISLEEKIGIFRSLGIDILIFIEFTPAFSRMSGEDFIENVIKNADMAYIAIGEDFKCGAGGSFKASDIGAFCVRRGVPCDIVPPVMLGGAPASSSRIRGALASGDIALARALLGPTKCALLESDNDKR